MVDWKKMGRLWNPEEKGEIKGKIIFLENKKEVNGYEYENVYTIETHDEIIKVCGTTVMDKQMELFKVGDFVKIVYKGKKKTENGKEYKDFDIYYGSE